jgi:tetrahedral aminopeptidase
MVLKGETGMSEKGSEGKSKLLRIGAAQIRLLERLCNASGISGDEGEVRSIVLEQVREHFKKNPGGEVRVDALGNVLVTCAGANSAEGRRPRVMLAAHMDEVGLMITHEEEKGIYRFDTVGGLDVRQLAGKPVWIGRDHTPGVIGAKAIHLVEPDEIKRTIPLETLRIDTGLGGNQKVKPGDRAAFATPFARIGPSLRAKALDNRLGVATLIELVKNAPPNIDLLAAFTVQEEVGLRGAKVAAYAFNPDLAFAIDSTPAYDLPVLIEGEPADLENTVYNSRLGAGPAIYIADAGTLSDPRLVRLLAETAESAHIPYQFRQPGGGGTDATAIHRQREGIPSVSVSVPGRYAHSAAGIARIVDWENTLALLLAVLTSLSMDILTQAR